MCTKSTDRSDLGVKKWGAFKSLGKHGLQMDTLLAVLLVRETTFKHLNFFIAGMYISLGLVRIYFKSTPIEVLGTVC